MQSYITHHFAHLDTLDRAYRWLLQVGISPGRIDAHREGAPWLTVRVGSGEKSAAEMIFEAAERTDPDGWPSFWELSRLPHPHFETNPVDVTGSSVVTAKPSPVGWHPPDRETVSEADYAVTDVWDVSTRFV